MRLAGLAVAFASSRCKIALMNTDDLYRLLRVNHVQAQGIVGTVSDPLVVLDSSLSVQAASRAFFDTFGVDSDETIGQPFYGLGNGQWDIPELRRLLEDVIPRSAAVINYQVEHNFPRLGQRTMLLTADPMSDMPTFIMDSGPSERHNPSVNPALAGIAGVPLPSPADKGDLQVAL